MQEIRLIIELRLSGDGFTAELVNGKPTTDTPRARAEPRPNFDFMAIYNIFPRKQGKANGLRKCSRDVKTTNDYLLLGKAVDKYVRHVKENYVEPKYIKMFSSFMSEWRDWTDKDVGTVTISASDPNKEARERAEREWKEKQNFETVTPELARALAKKAREAIKGESE